MVVAKIPCHLETPDHGRVSHFMVTVHTYYVPQKGVSVPWQHYCHSNTCHGDSVTKKIVTMSISCRCIFTVPMHT